LAIEYTGGIGTGALSAGATNGVTQALEVLSGKQCDFHVGEFLLNTGVGAAAGALPEFGIPGLSEGSNNWNAIGKSVQTKLANGTIQNVSGTTAAKALIGANVAGAYGTAAGVGATTVIDAVQGDGNEGTGGRSCGCK
jgi:hypothetical protein